MHIEGLPSEKARFNAFGIDHGLSSFLLAEFVEYARELRMLQVYEFIEVFAGVGMLSRCCQYMGYQTCSLDISYWSPWKEARMQKRLRKMCRGNPLDINSPAGFACFGFSVQGSIDILYICAS